MAGNVTTTASSIHLRAANPTIGDGLAFARYLDQAAEGFFRIMLGRRADEVVAKAFAMPDHGLSYQNATFAERDGVIVGMASGYPAEQRRRTSLQPLKEAAGPHHLRFSIVRTLFAPMMRIIDSIGADEFYLLAIAVDEVLRGQGVGSALADAIEARARAVGKTRLSLDVSAGNTNARRFYEERGMTVASRWPKRLALPGLTFYRMTKPV